MSIVIDEVVSEITPAATAASEVTPSATETARDDNPQKVLRLLKHYERRQQRLMAD